MYHYQYYGRIVHSWRPRRLASCRCGRALHLQSRGRGFLSWAHGGKTLAQFLTPVCLCHQAVLSCYRCNSREDNGRCSTVHNTGLKPAVTASSRPRTQRWAPHPTVCGATEWWLGHLPFIPRCMECQRGLAMSVCQTRALWQNGRKICPDFYTTRKIIQPSSLRRMISGGGDPFYLKFWVNWPRWSEIADFEPIFARYASAVIPSEKVQLALIWSSLCAF